MFYLLSHIRVLPVAKGLSCCTFLCRVLWCLVFLACMCWMIYNIVTRIERYNEQPTTIKMTFNNRKRLEFPAITICNKNSFRYEGINWCLSLFTQSCVNTQGRILIPWGVIFLVKFIRIIPWMNRYEWIYEWMNRYEWINEWMTVYPYIHTDMYKNTGNEPPWSVMLITRFTRVTLWFYVYV